MTDDDPGVISIGLHELPRFMGRRIHLSDGMQTAGAKMECACGFRATTRTTEARDAVELDHRRYHDWQAEQAMLGVPA